MNNLVFIPRTAQGGARKDRHQNQHHHLSLVLAFAYLGNVITQFRGAYNMMYIQETTTNPICTTHF
jgi:hypothetical protein